MAKHQSSEFSKWAKNHGWNGKKTKGGHIKWTHEKIPTPYFTASTPSCPRAIKNNISGITKIMKTYSI